MDKSQDSELFSAGYEVAPFVTSCGLLQRSWDVITSRHAGITYNIGVGLSWKVYKQQNVTIIAFENTLPYSSNLQSDMVSSSDLRDPILDHFKFLSTEENPIFSLNKTAVSLINDNHQGLNQLKSEDSIHDKNQVFQSIDYGYIVKSLSDGAILKDCVAQIGGINHPDSLHASISLQLQALGWTSPHMQQHVIDVNNLEILEKKFIHLKQKKAMEKIDTTLQKIEYSALEPSTSTFSDENLRHRRHDVFISFRGADTRITFVDHLYGHLTRKGIFVFKDDTTLEKGESISPQLLEAINNSRVAIVVFSSHYADSRWCLDEMAAITRCFWDNKLTVFPVFYDVDPSEVRKQNGVYEDAFRSHSSKRDSYNKVDQWRTTMTTLGGLVGWDVRNKSESAEIEIIAQAVIKKLGHKFSEVRS